MPGRIVGFLSLLLVSSALYSQQVLPGTWSYRTGPGGAVSNPLEPGVSDYFDMTSWDSSPFQQFRLHRGQDAPSDENFWLNFRMMFPVPYTQNPSEKYPMIVMLHGLGEAGVRGVASFDEYAPDDPRYLNNDHSLYHSGFSHLKAVNEGKFPGFVFSPQNISNWSDDNLDGVIAIIEELIKTYPIDPFRVYLHGYSNGGDGVWRIAEKRPDLFAALLPMSWVNLDVDRSKMIHLPIWYFQGELDNQPTNTSAQYLMAQFENEGGDPRYTEYLNAGHAIWGLAYAEPDFFSWMLGQTKTDIFAYYGRTTVCPGEDVNIRLGLSPGYASYQWRVTTDGEVETFPAGDSDNNEIVAQQTGDYQVRVSRMSSPGSGDWSAWSNSFPITIQDNIIAPDVMIDGSPHLPSPDGRTSADLSVPDEYENYQWYRSGNGITSSNSPMISISQAGDYYAAVSLTETCPPIFSDTVQITYDAPTNQINQPGNLEATAVSEVAIQLSWNDASNNESTFELYRSGSSNGTYSLIGQLEANTTSLKDSSLVPGTTYFYKIRAVNAGSASDNSNIASATTFTDETPPTVPGLLTYELIDKTEVELNWSASTDNSDIIIYDIIVNGQVIGSTSSLNYSLSGLQEETIYTIYIRARDRAGNQSELSNQATVITVFEGVMYKYYFGGLWEKTADYDNWPVEKQGYIDNVTIAYEAQGGVRPDIQENYFAFDFIGYLYIEQAGTYVFSLEAAAGSILNVGNFVLNNDGKHGPQTETASVSLGEGPHPFFVRYYDRTEEEILNIFYSGPDTNNELVRVPEEALTTSDKTFPDPPAAPTAFEATDVQVRRVDLEWMDESDNESGFEIFRAESEESPYVKVSTTSADQSTYADASLAPLHTYQFLVRAVGPSGTSAFDSLSATTALPLSLLNSECVADGNEITWSSSYPWLEEPYIIESSVDKMESNVLGIEDADSIGATYSWIDNSYTADTTYYRIGQRSPQGGVGYSEWIVSTCQPVGFKLIADLYPVPVTDGFLTIKMRSILPDQVINITIVDTIGRIFLETSVDPDPAKGPYNLDLTSLRGKGLYIVSIRQGGEFYQQKIIVEN